MKSSQLSQRPCLCGVVIRRAEGVSARQWAYTKHCAPCEAELLKARIENCVVLLDTGCWVWMLSLKNGYGQMSVHNESTYVHRLVYKLYIGPIPYGLDVCHRCDFRACCSPAHFFAGTRQENIADCIAKGRNSPPPRVTGERHHKATLTDEQVREVRRLRSERVPQREVARRFGVSQSAVWNMEHGNTRKTA